MEPTTTIPPEAATQTVPGAVELESLLDRLEARLNQLVQARLDEAQTRQRTGDRRQRLERFAEEHPDFLELQADGTLDALRADNPLLDEIGAYLTYRLEEERRQAATALDQARQEATRAAEASLLERVRTKRLAATLGTAPAGSNRGQGLGPELDAPEKFGGLTNVLAARLEARRKASGR